MRKHCLLKDLEETLEALQEEELLFDEEMIEEEPGESAIFVNTLRVIIPALQLELREGYYGLWQEDEEYYMADFSLTALYEEGASSEDFLMWEQDSPLITLYNYTRKPLEVLEELECVLVLE